MFVQQYLETVHERRVSRGAFHWTWRRALDPHWKQLEKDIGAQTNLDNCPKHLLLKYNTTSDFSNVILSHIWTWSDSGLGSKDVWSCDNDKSFFMWKQCHLSSQERLSSAAKSTSGSAATTPAPVWKEVGPRRATHTNAVSPHHPQNNMHKYNLIDSS